MINTIKKEQMMTNNTHSVPARDAVQTIHGHETSDGAGVRLVRYIASRSLDMLDPFLLFDVFRADDPKDYMAGFPPHPHRGFETVTYLLAGRMRHRDSAGHEGIIKPGGVQWMTAGRGLVHSEMPKQEEGLLYGFQLWVNLPSAQKMSPPRYQEFEPDAIPEEVTEMVCVYE
jgi:redox-sensitive bicupin YhaK (pirin superfamily)